MIVSTSCPTHKNNHTPLNTTTTPTHTPFNHSGVNTEPDTCRYYGFDPAKKECNHSAAGGGGRECGPTQICCVVWNPVQIQPDAQNSCVKRQ
jgi:hypothetical protein